METLPGGGRMIEEGGDLTKLSIELRGFLADLAGPVAPPPSLLHLASAPPSGLLNMSAVAMQPIKIGGKVKEEEHLVSIPSKNILEDEENQEERDTVLLSRGELRGSQPVWYMRTDVEF